MIDWYFEFYTLEMSSAWTKYRWGQSRCGPVNQIFGRVVAHLAPFVSLAGLFIKTIHLRVVHTLQTDNALTSQSCCSLRSVIFQFCVVAAGACVPEGK